jgi:hypothetical protein
MKRCKADKNLIQKLAAVFLMRGWGEVRIKKRGKVKKGGGNTIESHKKLSLQRLRKEIIPFGCVGLISSPLVIAQFWATGCWQH